MQSKLKNFFTVFFITFFLSFLLQGIDDTNIFVISRWRQNNIINILHFWFTFLIAYYLYSFILNIGFKKFTIDTSRKLIRLLLLTQSIAFLLVICTDILFYIIYYRVESLSETTFYEFDLPLTIVILTIGSLYFYQKNVFKSIPSDINTINSTPEIPVEKQIEVFIGSNNLFIKHSDIGVFYLAEKIVWIKTISGKVYPTNYSISKWTEELSSLNFFRINRQVIVSRKIVKGYRKLDYQKLEVLVEDKPDKDINLVVSKYNAPLFKKWLTNSV